MSAEHPAAPAAPPKLSAVEGVKEQSRFLRGGIAADLLTPGPSVTEESYNLLKFHGSYEQYDRDTATPRKKQGLEKEYQFMVRARIPGGRLTAEQYLALDAIADRYSNGTLRITTRQGIQFHGVLKGNLKATIADINHSMLTTMSACGDVVRNVMTTPAPIRDAVHARLEADARFLSTRLLPKSRAYYELFLDEESQAPAESVDEPLYGATYLPRKFKIGLATPEDNSIDLLTQDLGILSVFEGDHLVGYNLNLGGGQGLTHTKAGTHARMASPIASVGPGELLQGAEAVIRLYRDHGNRTDRKRARLKYVLDDMGLDWTRKELERQFGRVLADPLPHAPFQVPDHLGWHEQGDGRFWLGLPVASGRIEDGPKVRLRTALRALFENWAKPAVLTPQQDILIADIAPSERDEIEAHLRAHGVVFAEDLTAVRRWTLACPALPTCGLALSEAERIREPLVDSIEVALRKHGLIEERISIRITGCPNGCARPYAGDIGLVGRTPGTFALFVGGDFEGTRLNAKLTEKVPEAAIADTLDPLLGAFAQERLPGEGFGDWCHRQGMDKLATLLPGGKAL
ncbi:NADPH-dependent assimilatory sulfite reductase hemoprotein subunit [Mycobacterium sp. KBS0706]|uniref:NADPH-dependent assimilatory sulfite reductase hemoprotein subunit n=1 Tax=Mycobacterium sp. KBS0706 TaxID=2578109 RepID=UPI00110FF2D6|nr:NADPH-dependent assimilatory sulfite reductase hemoprotein subunit [Mycobacterium sp. KBS0706]TSD86327.1 NADPH-dependent assimilatory sulfite reductase hemoprotein subunit [Mycobacterium sp. KBS0706]